MACINKRYRIIVYPVDNSIEIIDVKTKKQYLKRIQFPSLQPHDFYVGNTLDIFGRRFRIIEFADKFTQENLNHNSERTFFMIKPDCYIKMGKIIDFLITNSHGLKINNALMLKLNEDVADELIPMPSAP